MYSTSSMYSWLRGVDGSSTTVGKPGWKVLWLQCVSVGSVAVPQRTHLLHADSA
jgi:hypothetical protein